MGTSDGDVQIAIPLERPISAIPQVPIVRSRITYNQTLEERDSRTSLTWVGNILWIWLAGGAVIAAVYAIFGILLIMTIVGIPFGFQLLKIARLALFPFGKHVDNFTTEGRFYSAVEIFANILFLPIGVFLCSIHLVMGVSCALWCAIPFTFQHLKLAELAIWPFGSREHYHEVVSSTIISRSNEIHFEDATGYGTYGK